MNVFKLGKLTMNEYKLLFKCNYEIFKAIQRYKYSDYLYHPAQEVNYKIEQNLLGFLSSVIYPSLPTRGNTCLNLVLSFLGVSLRFYYIYMHPYIYIYGIILHNFKLYINAFHIFVQFTFCLKLCSYKSPTLTLIQFVFHRCICY